MGERPLEDVRVGVAGPTTGSSLLLSLHELGASVTWGAVFESVAAPPARVEEETRAAVDAAPAWVVVTTAGGLRRWVAAAGNARAEVVAMLAGASVAARGQKAADACVACGAVPALVPAPERGGELVEAVAGQAGVGDSVVVQADGGGSEELVADLRAAGLRVHVVRPYRWVPPADPEPARALVRALVAAELDLLAFTSPPAVHGLVEVAADLGLSADLEAALADVVKVAAIGPATAEALEARGVPVTVYPVRPRTAALVTALATAARVPKPPPLVRLDPARRSARVGDDIVVLSELEFSLLASLARRPATTCPTSVLIREVWGAGGERRRLEALVSRLRTRVAPLGLAVASVPKRGYRLLRLTEAAGDRPGDPASLAGLPASEGSSLR